MSLLLPETGLIFWMLLSFGIVAFVVVKFGFPVILKMVEERKNYIEDSLLQAQKARDEVDKLKHDSTKILAEARQEHARIIQEANLIKEKMIVEAERRAITEGEALIEKARVQIELMKNDALKDIRVQIADLSIGLTEKLLRKKLDDRIEQKEYIQQLMNDINHKQS